MYTTADISLLIDKWTLIPCPHWLNY